MQYLPHSFFQERERKAMGKDPDIWIDLQTGRCGVVLWLKKRSILSCRSTDVTVNYTPVIQQYYYRVSRLAQGMRGFFRQLKSLSFTLFLYDCRSFLDQSAMILSTPSQFFRSNHLFLQASFLNFLGQFLSVWEFRISSSALMPSRRDNAQTSTSSNAVPVIKPAQSNPLILILFKFCAFSTKQLEPGIDLQQGYMPQQVRQLLQQQQQQLPQQFFIVSPQPNFQVSSKVSREAMVGLTALSRSTILPCTEGYLRVSKMISVRLSCMKPKLCSMFLMASPWFLKQCASMQSSQVSLIFTYRSFQSQLVSSALGKSLSYTKLSIMQQTSIESSSVMPALIASERMAPAEEPITLVMGRGMFPRLSLWILACRSRNALQTPTQLTPFTPPPCRAMLRCVPLGAKKRLFYGQRQQYQISVQSPSSSVSLIQGGLKQLNPPVNEEAIFPSLFINTSRKARPVLTLLWHIIRMMKVRPSSSNLNTTRIDSSGRSLITRCLNSSICPYIPVIPKAYTQLSPCLRWCREYSLQLCPCEKIWIFESSSKMISSRMRIWQSEMSQLSREKLSLMVFQKQATWQLSWAQQSTPSTKTTSKISSINITVEKRKFLVGRQTCANRGRLDRGLGVVQWGKDWQAISLYIFLGNNHEVIHLRKSFRLPYICNARQEIIALKLSWCRFIYTLLISDWVLCYIRKQHQEMYNL